MTGKNNFTKSVQISLLSLALVLLQGVHPLHAADTKVPLIQDCEINNGFCTKKTAAVTVALDVAPKPVKAMKELVFTVTVKGTKEYESLKLKLQMPGMYMGDNVVELVKVGDGKYTGKGVVPKCHSGKRLWSATLELPGLNPSETSFLFNVLY
jgi:hypothetical protein